MIPCRLICTRSIVVIIVRRLGEVGPYLGQVGIVFLFRVFYIVFVMSYIKRWNRKYNVVVSIGFLFKSWYHK
jgi:predicted branched-subunit amino acid permease